jgi:DNA-binding transcriptional MocR family regulator
MPNTGAPTIAGGRWHDQIVKLKYGQSLACPALLGMAVAEFLASGRIRPAPARGGRGERRALSRGDRRGVSGRDARVGAARGYALWVELPPGNDALALHDAALRRRIVIAPGPLFSARARFANVIRISCGSPWSERTAEGIRTLARLVSEQR